MSPLLNAGLADVSTDGPPQLEPGVYTLQATKVEVKPPIDDKAAQVVVTFVDANADPGADGSIQSVRKTFSMSKAAKCYFKRWLVAAGSDLAEAEEIDTDDLIGLQAKAVVVANTASDKDTGEVRTYANVGKFMNAD